MLSKLKSIIPYKKRIKSYILGFIDTIVYFVNSNRIHSIDFEHLQTVNFICYGNICRSPFAENFMKKKLKENNIDVVSTGFFNQTDRLPPAEAIEAANLLKTPLVQHRSNKISDSIVEKSSIIIGMDYSNVKQFKKLFPGCQKNIYLLKHFVWPRYLITNIKDPYSKPTKDFIKCYKEISFCVENLIQRIEKANT